MTATYFFKGVGYKKFKSFDYNFLQRSDSSTIGIISKDTFEQIKFRTLGVYTVTIFSNECILSHTQSSIHEI